MSNIWEFLLQTTEVTLTAAMILLVKLMFQDKLSPRWQYGVWTILAVKLVLPAGLFARYLSVDLAACIEAGKLIVERRLESQFGDIYQLADPVVGIPMITGVPQSITDWMFVIYIAGVLLCVVYYLFGYLRLKRILRRGWTGTEELQEKIETVCRMYQLQPCEAVVLDNIDSAFVCGYIHPVMAIPAHQEEHIDEKIILHELLHRKYGDVWQNTFWCLMRCIHWCNPVMQIIFNRIGNDMESLCDQRVLEQVQGEERRDYGRILLNMTNQKYARALGTTSLSNGGKNIKERIKTIVRFKQYPKGMALASVCVCVLLACPVFGGTNQTLNFEDSSTIYFGRETELAKIRIQGCSTAAGAIDTYVKGLLFDDERYITAVTRTDQQYRADAIAVSNDVWPIYDKYCIMNLQEQEDESLTAYILLCEMIAATEADSESEGTFHITALPIRLYQEHQRWIVEADGDKIDYETSYEPGFNYQSQLPPLKTYKEDAEHGTVLLQEQSMHYIKTELTDGHIEWFYHDNQTLHTVPKTDAAFSRHELHYTVTYNHDEMAERKDIETVAISARMLTKDYPEPDWSGDSTPLTREYKDSYGDDGEAFVIERFDSWRGELLMDKGWFAADQFLQEAKAYAVRIYINKLPVEDMIIERGE